MPIYEYDCPRCGRFEAIQKMSARPLGKHQACGSRVKRVMSAGTFSFKGSGFYATDYKGGGAAKAAACENSGSSKACATCPASDSKAA
jgi:putative FmdB family regulatory protein